MVRKSSPRTNVSDGRSVLLPLASSVSTFDVGSNDQSPVKARLRLGIGGGVSAPASRPSARTAPPGRARGVAGAVDAHADGVERTARLRPLDDLLRPILDAGQRLLVFVDGVADDDGGRRGRYRIGRRQIVER